MRLIDADALLEKAHMIHVKEVGYTHRCVDYFHVLEAPTIEAEPIRHGHWKKRSETDVDGNAWYSCSECEHGDYHAEDAVVPYCWYCGAKMDEVEP